MIRFGLVALAALFLCSFAYDAEVCAPVDELLRATEPLARARCFAGKFKSKSLGGRDIDFRVLAPRGYPDSKNNLPYAIFLHGRSGSAQQIVDLNARDSLERVAKPFLIFSLSGADHYWMNAAISGEKWGDLATEDFVSYIESSFHVAKGKPERRALFGISMGGHAVLQLGLNRPGVFAVGLSISPVFRREQDIWIPDGSRSEPREDYDSFGQGSLYETRSPRHLCEKSEKRASSGECLPFSEFRLGTSPADPLLDRYPDTRRFIEELKARHAKIPQFQIGLERCMSHVYCGQFDDNCQGHSYGYWNCMMPSYLDWLSQALNR